MNDTGGGVTAIHDVPGDITRIGFHWMLFFSFLPLEGGFYLFFTRSVAEVTGFSLSRIFELFLHTECRGIIFFITNYRIIELSNIFHTECRGGHGIFCPDFFPCPEFANYRIVSSHGMSRSVAVFFIPRLVLGPTDQREVIVEFLSITRSVADGCGACSSCEWGLFVVVYRPIWGVCV